MELGTTPASTYVSSINTMVEAKAHDNNVEEEDVVHKCESLLLGNSYIIE